MITWKRIKLFFYKTCLKISDLGFEKSLKRSKSSVVYHNIVGAGDELPMDQRSLIYLMEKHVVLMKSDEAMIAMVHGNVDGSTIVDLFNLNGIIIGRWTLVSCYNGNRDDIFTSSYSLIRERNTITDDAIAFKIINGDLYLNTDKSLVETAKNQLVLISLIRSLEND